MPCTTFFRAAIVRATVVQHGRGEVASCVWFFRRYAVRTINLYVLLYNRRGMGADWL